MYSTAVAVKALQARRCNLQATLDLTKVTLQPALGGERGQQQRHWEQQQQQLQATDDQHAQVSLTSVTDTEAAAAAVTVAALGRGVSVVG